ASSSSTRHVDPENRRISQIFLDAIKSTWLLIHIRGETTLLETNQILNSFTNLIEKRMSNHILRFYNEVFEMPDYDAIEDHGDFKFSIRGYSMSSPSRNTTTIELSRLIPCVESQPQTSPVGCQLSPPSQMFSTPTKRVHRKKVPGPSIDQTNLLGSRVHPTSEPFQSQVKRQTPYSDQPLPPHNCEFASGSTSALGQGTDLPIGPGVVITAVASLAESLNHESLPHRSNTPFSQGPDARHSPEQAMTWVSPYNESLLQLPHNVGQPSSDSSREIFELNALPTSDNVSQADGSLHTTEQESGLHVTSLEYSGLHVTLLENAPDPRGIEHIYILPGETEIFNEWPGSVSRFYNDILSSNGTTFVPSNLRLFRTLDGRIHIHTQREGDRMHDFYIDPTTTELIPQYAFNDDRSRGSEIFFRQDGDLIGLRYKFLANQSCESQLQLYDFQGLLTRMIFGGQYKVKKASLFDRHTTKHVYDYPKIQFWTESTRANNASSLFTGAKFSLDQIEKAKGRLNASKMLLFADGCIFILILSERIALQRPGSLSRSGSHCLRITPIKGTLLKIKKLKYLPICQNGTSFTDQDGIGFETYKSVEIEFLDASNCQGFSSTFAELQNRWLESCASIEYFRELQRNRRLIVK
ncbi:hypothetical protein Egran_02880, partial [Elaphomyces granulatus]